MDSLRNVYSLFSLCARSGTLKFGETSVERALSERTCLLVVVTTDASANTRKKFSQKTFFYNVPYVEFSDKATLSKATGTVNRVVFAVCDKGFADRLSVLLKEIEVNICPKRDYTIWPKS